MSKKKALGRGLSALLSDSEDERSEVDITSPAVITNVTNSNLNEILIDEIDCQSKKDITITLNTCLLT